MLIARLDIARAIRFVLQAGGDAGGRANDIRSIRRQAGDDLLDHLRISSIHGRCAMQTDQDGRAMYRAHFVASANPPTRMVGLWTFRNQW